jgi:hypothetical protein
LRCAGRWLRLALRLLLLPAEDSKASEANEDAGQAERPEKIH